MKNFLNKEKFTSTLSGAISKARTSIANVQNKNRDNQHSQSIFQEDDEFILEDNNPYQSNFLYRSNSMTNRNQQQQLEEQSKQESNNIQIEDEFDSNQRSCSQLDQNDIIMTSIPTHNVFDENSFDFRLVGGPIHTDVLIASATMKKGDNIGLPVPLHCTWYNVSPITNEFKVIENVCGACYQPSIDDVGDRICVHAIPASDAEEYQGMPMFAEIGPLIVDLKIVEKAQKLMDINEMMFNISIDQLKDQTKLTQNLKIDSQQQQQLIKLPFKARFRIKDSQLKFISLTYSDQILFELDISPKLDIQIIKHVNNKIEVLLKNHFYGFFSLSSNIERDIFVTCFRQIKQQIVNELKQIEEIKVGDNIDIQNHNDTLRNNDAILDFNQVIDQDIQKGSVIEQEQLEDKQDQDPKQEQLQTKTTEEPSSISQIIEEEKMDDKVQHLEVDQNQKQDTGKMSNNDILQGSQIEQNEQAQLDQQLDIAKDVEKDQDTKQLVQGVQLQENYNVINYELDKSQYQHTSSNLQSTTNFDFNFKEYEVQQQQKQQKTQDNQENQVFFQDLQNFIPNANKQALIIPIVSQSQDKIDLKDSKSGSVVKPLDLLEITDIITEQNYEQNVAKSPKSLSSQKSNASSHDSQVQQVQKRNLDLTQQLTTFRHNYARKLEHIKQQDDLISKLKSDITFFKQEASLYEKENKKISKKLGQLQAQKELQDMNLIKSLGGVSDSDTTQSNDQKLEIKSDMKNNDNDKEVQTDIDIGETISQIEELQKNFEEMKQQRDKLMGEQNYSKKKLLTLQQENDKLLKKLQKFESSSIQLNQTATGLSDQQKQSQSMIMCGGCGAEILDTSHSSSSENHPRNKNYASQTFTLDHKNELQKNFNNTFSNHQPTKPSNQNPKRPSIQELISPKFQNQLNNDQILNYPGIQQESGSDEKLYYSYATTNSNTNQLLQKKLQYKEAISDDDPLVDDFVNQVHNSVLNMSHSTSYNNTMQNFPEERLAALIEENAQMKIDVEKCLEKLKQQDFLIEEYKRQMDEEIKKSNQYRQLLSHKSSGTGLGSIIGGSKQTEQMQKLINHLTIMLGEKDEEISVTKNINRELARKLKELAGIR
eukprot:403332120